MITIENDTIYGQIELMAFRNYQLTTQSGEKIKITSKLSLEFRKDGFKYVYKKKKPYTIGDKKHAYLKLINDGEVKLYEYRVTRQMHNSTMGESFYYVERDNEIHIINSARLLSILHSVIPENKILFEKIKSRELSHKDMYLIIKYYNTMPKV